MKNIGKALLYLILSAPFPSCSNNSWLNYLPSRSWSVLPSFFLWFSFGIELICMGKRIITNGSIISFGCFWFRHWFTFCFLFYLKLMCLGKRFITSSPVIAFDLLLLLNLHFDFCPYFCSIFYCSFWGVWREVHYSWSHNCVWGRSHLALVSSHENLRYKTLRLTLLVFFCHRQVI